MIPTVLLRFPIRQLRPINEFPLTIAQKLASRPLS